MRNEMERTKNSGNWPSIEFDLNLGGMYIKHQAVTKTKNQKSYTDSEQVYHNPNPCKKVGGLVIIRLSVSFHI